MERYIVDAAPIGAHPTMYLPYIYTRNTKAEEIKEVL
jgi:hypothetical protein